LKLKTDRDNWQFGCTPVQLRGQDSSVGVQIALRAGRSVVRIPAGGRGVFLSRRALVTIQPPVENIGFFRGRKAAESLRRSLTSL